MATTFSSVAYKISKSESFNKEYDEFTNGIDKENLDIPENIRIKINHGLRMLGKPWEHCIPYYKNAIFVFISDRAIKYFLFRLCNLNDEDINVLINLGYKLYKLEISCITSGLSNIRGTIFEDEIIEKQEISFDELFGNYRAPKIELIPEHEIKTTKQNYYNKFKIYF